MTTCVSTKTRRDKPPRTTAKLAEDGVKLTEDSTYVKPYIVDDAAEEGGKLALSILFDIDSCPLDKSISELDFTALSQEKCQQNLVDTLSQVCTWRPASARRMAANVLHRLSGRDLERFQPRFHPTGWCLG